MQRIVDDTALAAALNEIDHEISMMGYSDEETALDDWEFSGPRIRRAVDTLRSIIKKSPSAPNKTPEEPEYKEKD